jgi:uncharacterized protein YkwD
MAIKFEKLAGVLGEAVVVTAAIVVILSVFLAGYTKGYTFGKSDQIAVDQKSLSQIVSATTRPAASSVPSATSPPIVKTVFVYVTPKPAASWGGPQLWEAINKRRVELGVNPLQVKEEMCTIASLRLNEILTLGHLDGHEGFSKLPADRPDIKPTFDKYNLAEFLVSGATSAQNAVDLWENTLGHKELLSGGQYVWGCTYAQSGFGVAIAAY